MVFPIPCKYLGSSCTCKLTIHLLKSSCCHTVLCPLSYQSLCKAMAALGWHQWGLRSTLFAQGCLKGSWHGPAGETGMQDLQKPALGHFSLIPSNVPTASATLPRGLSCSQSCHHSTATHALVLHVPGPSECPGLAPLLMLTTPINCRVSFTLPVIFQVSQGPCDVVASGGEESTVAMDC